MRSSGTVCVAALFAFLLGATALAGRPSDKRVTPAACSRNADCVLVTDGCCGCTEGGKQRAIPAKARDAYEKKRRALCRGTICPQLMSEHVTCTASEAVCKEGQCALGS